MSLFHKKRKVTEVEIAEPVRVERLGWKLEVATVISKVDCMIVRVKVKFPATENGDFEIVAKTHAGDVVSQKCVFMGKGECLEKIAGKPVFKELLFSVFVQYPEQDLFFSLISNATKQVIHEQLISGEKIKELRAKEDVVLYRTAAYDPYYQEWFDIHKASEYELQMQREAQLFFQPKFSIVVPLFKTPLNFFNELMAAITAQTYSNWELILVNASVEDASLRSAVQFACSKDARVTALELEKNEGITLNTAYGIEYASGDFVCFIDHDDLIEPNCLFEYAQAVNDNPEVELLYCDEDKLYPDGRLSEVNFKPDFSLHYLRSNNYICHMLCIKRDLLRSLEYKNEKYDGAQDHHLTLQAVERAKGVVHIPKVLYHWRLNEGSTAGGGEAKPYAATAGINAVTSHLERMGVKAKVHPHPTVQFTMRVEYDVPKGNPLVSIIIPTNDHVDLLRPCIESILKKSTYNNYEILVVENNSKDQKTFQYYKTLEADKRIKVVTFKGVFNFSKVINFGRFHARGEYLILLNNDTKLITSNWIETMLGICCQPEVGIVGCKLLFPDDTIQHAGVYVGDKPYHYFHSLPVEAINYGNYALIQREVSAVTAACMMVDIDTFDSVDGFNEEMQVDYNDVDFCFKVRKNGKVVVYNPDVQLYHYESISRGYDAEVENQTRKVCEWGKILSNWPREFAASDPYHTPNICQRPQASYFQL